MGTFLIGNALKLESLCRNEFRTGSARVSARPKFLMYHPVWKSVRDLPSESLERVANFPSRSHGDKIIRIFGNYSLSTEGEWWRIIEAFFFFCFFFFSSKINKFENSYHSCETWLIIIDRMHRWTIDRKLYRRKKKINVKLNLYKKNLIKKLSGYAG